MKFRWSLAPKSDAAEPLAAAMRISPLLAQCLINRGINEAKLAASYLEPRLKNLADPFLLPGMKCAVDRLMMARERGENVVIFGDYDVDGVTATALLLEVLGALGWRVQNYFPNRLEEGYGLSQDAVESCQEKLAPSLVLAVDCGSTAVSSIGFLREKGVDTIVVDHHQVSDPLPPAVALVNPKVPRQETSNEGNASGETFTQLCSVGLAFKLAHAIVKQMRAAGVPEALQIDLRRQLDLVALGTVADLVPITGENRIFVATGLERLSVTDRPGLVALMEVAQCSRPVGCHEVGFQLGPRLNAAGRLEDAEEALHLLRARNAAEATPLAQSLDSRNRQRQQIERAIAEQVIGAVRARFDPARDFIVVEGQLSWHIGVVGIVASRVLQEFYRPAIILGGEGEIWRGSGRSVEGFDLAAALRECSDLLVTHGGHAMAAGLSIQSNNLVALRERLNALARSALMGENLSPKLVLDAVVTLDDLALPDVDELDRLNPCGQGNPGVRLIVRGLSYQYPPRRMGKENQHLKFRVTDGRQSAEAVWWNCGDSPLPQSPFDLAIAPSVNEYQGLRSVQLKVLDWRPFREPENVC